jgi:hypothetical protein
MERTPGGQLRAPATPQGVDEVEADDVDLARRLGLDGGVAAEEELREVERDLARLVAAMNGAAGGATNLRAGRHRDMPIRVFDHVVMRRDGSRQAHTVVGYAVPSGHDMEMMLQLPVGMFAESKDGLGAKVLLLPAPRWMYYLIPGHFQRGEQLVRFADSWLEIHAQTFSTRSEQAPAPPRDSALPPANDV